MASVERTKMTKSKRALEGVNASRNSTDRAVGRRAGRLLDVLESVNTLVARGTIVEECGEFYHKTLAALKAEGWRVKIDSSNKHQVLPPVPAK